MSRSVDREVSAQFASGPMTVRASDRAPSRGKCPVSGTRPKLGFSP